MANVFRQFLRHAEHGDVEAVQRNIENGIDLDTRDEVRSERDNLIEDPTKIDAFRINKQP